MPLYRINQVARLLGVSDDTVRRWAESGRLPLSRDQAGRGVIEGRAVAELAVSLAETPEPGSATHSARNRFTGIVTRVVVDGVMAQVELAAGPFRVVSLISRESVEQLGLEPGVMAVASIKATNVTIEIPG